MKVSYTHILFLFVLVIGFEISGCSSENVPESTTTLTSSEQEAVAMIAGAAVDADEEELLNTLQQETITVEDKIRSCESGGTFVINGTFIITRESSDASSGMIDQSAVFNDCKVKDRQSDNTLTLNGNLDTKGSISISLSDEVLISNISALGALNVEGNQNGAGTCGISIKTDLSLSSIGIEAIVKGSVCGDSYSFSESGSGPSGS